MPVDRTTFCVVDIGTQSLRSSLVDQEGHIVHFEREVYDYPAIPSDSSRCEQWPDYYWERMVRTLSHLTASEEFKKNPPIGLVFCDFRDTAALLDSDLKPVRPSILWFDPRNAKLEKDHNLSPINKFLMKVVGMYETARYNGRRTAAQWLKENQPETWKRIAKYVPLGAYFNLKLTGNLVCSAGDCIGHYPMNFSKGEWLGKSNMKWEIFGIRPDQLCDLVPVGGIVGRITDECAALTGLPSGLPVYASAADKACEVLGNGCYTPDRCTLSFGTACTVDQPVRRYKNSEPFLPAYRAPVADLYDMEVQIYRGFSMLRWFAQNFGSDEERKKAKDLGVPIESIFDSYLKEVKPGSDGLIVQPYWGPGLSRPVGRGAMIGFTDVHGKKQIYRAIIEGITYALREGLETLEKRSHHRAQTIVVSGGGSRSDEIQRIATDVFNLPTVRAETTQSCTVGAALGGFVAARVYRSADAAVSRMVRTGHRMDPDPENARIYEGYFRTYREIYPHIRGIDARLKKLSTDSDIC